MMNRNYPIPRVGRLDPQWAMDRETDMAVACAIQAIADKTRTPQMIWSDPTPAEVDHVTMAIEEYVINGDFENDHSGFCWGETRIRVDGRLTSLQGED